MERPMNRKERRKRESAARGGPPADFVEALRLLEANRTHEAELALRCVLERQPGHADSVHLLGVIAHQVGRHREAAELLKRAVALSPKAPSYWNNLGLALLKSGEPDGAVEAFGRAARLKPESAEIHANLAKALHARGAFKEAQSHFRTALSLKPTLPQARVDWAAMLYANGQADAAAEQYEQVLEIDPGNLLARSNLGRVLYKRGDLAGAEAHLRRCLELDPGDRHGVRLLLAVMGKAPPPDRISDTFVRSVYAERAKGWDETDTYFAHRLAAAAVEKFAGRGALDIADVGCGTGLVGALVRDKARRLDGVDLSAEMLAVAGAKAVYDNLHQDELTAWLARTASQYDVVVSAATLIHFGDLLPPMEAAAHALRPSGLFVLTLFGPADPAEEGRVTISGGDLGLAGCFIHGRRYVRDVAARAGFRVEMLADEVHERNNGAGVPGLVVVLRREPS
jgi:predicted TPR repeat methyltransferase